MTSGLARRSPLADLTLPDGLRELPFLAMIDLRADPSDDAVRHRFANAMGFELPSQPNALTEGVAHRALWLGPDEWLVIGPPDSGEDLEASLRTAIGWSIGAVVDVSANRTTLELSGSRAREILEAGCSIDLHPRAFGPGRCAQTLLARTSVMLLQLSDEPRYHILVRPSFAAYVAAWLTDAMDSLGR